MNSGTLAAVLIGAVVGTAMISVAFVYAAKAFSSAQSQVTNWLTGLTWFVCGVCLIVLALMLAFPAG